MKTEYILIGAAALGVYLISKPRTVERPVFKPVEYTSIESSAGIGGNGPSEYFDSFFKNGYYEIFN